MGTKPFLTPEEVAGILRISVDTVYRYIRDGSLPAFKVGAVYRVRQEDLDRFVEQGRVQPKQPKTPKE